jgi:hypothetical protein
VGEILRVGRVWVCLVWVSLGLDEREGREMSGLVQAVIEADERIRRAISANQQRKP